MEVLVCSTHLLRAPWHSCVFRALASEVSFDASPRTTFRSCPAKSFARRWAKFQYRVVGWLIDGLTDRLIDGSMYVARFCDFVSYNFVWFCLYCLVSFCVHVLGTCIFSKSSRQIVITETHFQATWTSEARCLWGRTIPRWSVGQACEDLHSHPGSVFKKTTHIYLCSCAPS